MGRGTITHSTRLATPASVVWAHATRMRSINEEMGPFMKMTYPKAAESMTLSDADVRLGEPLFRSWVLAFGMIPIERLDVTLVELEPGRRLVEQSRTLGMKLWRHERIVEPDTDGCRVTDRLDMEAPLAFATPVVRRIMDAFFGHRHRKLLERFGAASA